METESMATLSMGQKPMEANRSKPMEQKLMEQNPMNPIFGTADCSTCQIEYFSFGKGPDNLLILPGLSIRPVCQSAQFVASQYRCLCNDFTIFVFESRRDMPKGYTIRQMADDTAVAMQTLGIGRACVFGASHGGMIAQELAINYPNLVSGMILASTISAHNDTSTATMKRWSTLAEAGEPVALNRDIFQHVYSPEYYAKYREAFNRIEDSGSPAEIRRFGIMAESIIEFDVDSRLSEIECPAYVFGIENDTVLSGQASYRLTERLHCNSTIFPGTGHSIFDEMLLGTDPVRKIIDQRHLQNGFS